MKKLLVPVLCVLLGCAGGAAMGSVTAQTWPASPSAAILQQECVFVPNRDRDSDAGREVDRLARAKGAEGWELVSAFAPSPAAIVVCFKRPAP